LRKKKSMATASWAGHGRQRPEKLRYNAKKSSRLFGREDFIVSNTSSCRVPSFVAFAENVIK
jgi:hypothetical protein